MQSDRNARAYTRGLALGASLAALLAASPAVAGSALPTGGQVAAGQATIGASSNGLVIGQASGHAIINWQNFSIGAGNGVQFNNGSGATLNRVTGGNLSQIDGVLKATGSVYLINPQGVVVGPGGKVITGGSFVASTRDVDNDAFMKGGPLHATGTSNGAVVNQGKIVSRYGDTILIGKSVSNSGIIKASRGTAGLAAGDDVTLRPMDGDARISISAGKGDVTNTGTIAAAQAELNAAGGNVYAVAGNQGGITVTGTREAGGRIWLTGGGTTQISGTVKAINADGSGGTIIATGSAVQVDADARISASGATGGTILLGGDEAGGSDPARKHVAASVATAKTTTVAQGAQISADGSAGAGGSVVVWSDEYTSYNGVISARGATAGGFTEVSSHGVLDFLGLVDLTSAHGATGNLLLDPFAVTIVAGTGGTISGGVFKPTAASSLGATTLINALASANVTVNTGTTGSGAGSITLSSGVDLTWTSASTLTLDASRNAAAPITLNGAIAATGGGLTLKAGSSATITDTAAISVGTFTLTSGNWVQTTASLPVFSASNFVLSGGTFLRVAGGDGSNTPYQVADIYGLQGMQGFTGSNFNLANDIDASSTATWNGGAGFVPLTLNSGLTFDGQNHTISGLTISQSNWGVGLFSSNGGTIQNVMLSGGSVTDGGGIGAGALVGNNSGAIINAHSSTMVGGADGSDGANYLQQAGGLVGSNSGTISNSSASGAVSGYNQLGGLVGVNYGQITNSSASGRVTPGALYYTFADAGGLAGRNEGGTIDGGSASGDVVGQLIAGYGGVGGLVGTNTGTIKNSHASGNVTASTAAGGLVGTNGGYSNGTAATGSIDNSYYELGTVTGYDDTGGLVGANGDYFSAFSGVITNAHVASTATVVGTRDVGGLAGSNYDTGSITGSYSGATVKGDVGNSGDQIYEVGGLVGRSGGMLSGSYATGAVDGGNTSYYIGGLAGEIGGTVTNVYATGTVAGGSAVGGLVGVVDGSVDNSHATGAVTVYTGTGGGFAGIVDGTVTNSYATGAVTAADASLSQYGQSAGGLGGFVGINSGTISGSYASGAVTGGDGSDGTNYGSSMGGFAATNSGTLSLVHATGSVQGYSYIGGLVGSSYFAGPGTGIVSDSYATGAVTGGGGSVGGLIGDLSGSVTRSYATGTVTGTGSYAVNNPYYLGGLIGQVEGGGSVSFSYATGEVDGLNMSAIGGLVGGMTDGTSRITDSYAIGAVNGAIGVGGFIGDLEGGSITNSYASNTVSAYGPAAFAGVSFATISNSYYDNSQGIAGFGFNGGTGSATGLTTAQMHVSSNFAGFDFVNTWAPADATYRPELYGVSYVVKVIATGGTAQYGDAISSALTYHSLQNGDLASSITGLTITGATQGSSVGTYAINASGAALTSSSGNTYRFIYDNGSITITPRLITVQADAAGKTYGAADPAFTYSITSGTFLSGDSIGGLLSRNSGSNVGTYAITQGTLAVNNSNYAINFLGANLVIDPATLTYTADAASRTYGASNPVFGGGVSGLVNGDTLTSAVTGTLAFTSSAMASSNAGSYAINGSGLSAVNYVFVQDTSNATALTIGKATLTFTAGAVSRAYGSANGTLSGGITGYVLGQTQSTVFSGTPGWSATATTTTDVGNYAITGSGTFRSGMGTNYTIVQAAANATALTITPKTLTWSVSANGTATYGTLGTLGTVTLTGIVSGDTTKVSGVTGLFDGLGNLVAYTLGTDAGSYTQKAASLTGVKAGDYVLAATGTTRTFAIAQKSLTYSTANASGTYGVVSSFGAATLTGVIAADIGLVSGTEGLFSGTTPVTYVFNMAAGAYSEKVTGLTGTKAGNYTIAASGNTAGTYTVNKAALTYATANAGSTYGTAGALGAVTFSGLVAGDGSNITGTEALYSEATPVGYVFNTAAGSYQEKVTGISGTGASNYTLAPSGNTIGTFTIAQRAITVTANSGQQKTYGDADPARYAYQVTTGSLVSGDALSGLLTRDPGENAGNYVIGQGTLAASSNYDLTYAGATFAINPMALAVMADAGQIKTYGDADPAFTYGFTTGHLVGTDTLTGALTRDAGEDAGSYAINQGSLSSSANYTLSFTPGTNFNITPMALTVVAAAGQIKTYGDADPVFGYTIGTGHLVGGDTLGGAPSRDAGENVGAYAITQGSLVSSANYTLAFVPGTLNITPAALTITAGSSGKVYGDTASLDGFTASGLVSGDSVDTLALTSSGAAAAANAGSYAILASGAAGSGLGNYVISYNPGVLTVTPRALVVTIANASAVYGAARPDFTASASGLVNGDTLSGAPVAAGTHTGSYAITQGTLAASANYVASFRDGTFTITPAGLTITAGNIAAQNVSLARPTATYAGLVNGDSSAVVSGLQFGLFPVTGSSYDVVPFGASAADYTIVYAAGVLTINAQLPSQIALAIPPQSGSASGSLTIGGQTFVFSNAATSAIPGSQDGGPSGVTLFQVGLPGHLSGFTNLVVSDYSNATSDNDRLATE